MSTGATVANGGRGILAFEGNGRGMPAFTNGDPFFDGRITDARRLNELLIYTLVLITSSPHVVGDAEDLVCHQELAEILTDTVLLQQSSEIFLHRCHP